MREPKDSEYRRLIVQSLDQSVMVEAGAGSGKTTSLVGRMLALIASGSASVYRMAAVTFTRKGAAELKGKFQIALEKSIREETDPIKHERYEEAMKGIDLLFTGTIHSFCARLLRELPIEARLDPDFQELEENENTILRDRCWLEYLERLYVNGDPILQAVTELGINPADLMQTYQNIALYPEVEVVREPRDRPDFTTERKKLKDYLRQAWKGLPRTVPEKGWDKLQELLVRARRRNVYMNLDNDLDFVSLLRMMDKSPKVTLNRWPDPDLAKAQEKEFEKLREDLVGPCLESWRAYCHYFVMELVVPAVEYFREVREKSSLLNFQDLLLKTAQLLREKPEVRGYFQKRFTHILVDEFQDTDPIQAEVILYLTSADLQEKSWRRVRVKPGALLIVGDPKQSIYRFRRADIDTYNEVKWIIADSAGLIIPLTANFRSLPAICNWLNPIFQATFPEKETRHQAAFEPLDPFREDKEGGVCRIGIAQVPRHNQEEVARQDAERIAAWIDWALKGNYEIREAQGKARHPAPGDFMILLRYRATLPLYARALEGRGIPYDITGGSAFKDSEEIGQLLNLLRAVAEPEDQLALVATLRGQFFGISDDLIYRYRAGGGTLSFLASPEKCADGEARGIMGNALSQLSLFHRWASTKPPGAALGLILDCLGIVPLALAREMGQSRAGNLLKALELALWDSAALTSFTEMVSLLTEYYQEAEVEEMSVNPGRKDAVKLMNLHKAKGLEAEVVFLADPLREPQHEPYIHINRAGGAALGYFVAYWERNYQREIVGLPPGWSDIKALEDSYQQAEVERLLYVASTRAKQMLAVSTYPSKSDKGGWKNFYPYLREVEHLQALVLPPQHRVEKTIVPEALEAARQGITDRLSSCTVASYETGSVTKDAKASTDSTPFSGDSEQGLSWGRIIHRLLEALARDAKANLDLLAHNLLVEEERPLSEKEAVLSMVKSVIDSELWGRMQKASERLIEVPFSLKIGQAVPKVITGVIDLVFKEPDGWVIADYKTDKVDGNLEALTAYYRPQVEMYKEFWECIVGESVKEIGFYFVNIGKWVTI